MSKNARILVISDQHFPYNHPDIVAFLKALNKKYKPDKIINIGDEVDLNSFSYHEKEPDLLSPSSELATAIRRLQPIYKLFPEMDLLESNHGSLVYRKGKTAGLPKNVFKSYREIIEAPKKWRWFPDLTVKMSNGKYVYFCHGKSADVLKLSQSMGMCAVQGHYHEKFEVRYWGNSLGLFWGAIIGCLIENKSLAFAYNKLNLKRPVIGCMMILNGLPHLTPMVLNSNGRWNGFVP